MPIDVHTTEDQREPGQVVPDGTFVKLRMTYKEGGHDFGFDEASFNIDRNLFSHKKDWQQGDPITLQCEYTVQGGPYNGAKSFGYQTVSGGELDSSGNSKGWAITKRNICGWLNSAMGLDPKDESPQARQSRQFEAFRRLDGIEFYARLGIEEGNARPDGTGNYPDKNVIAHIVEATDPEYAPLRAGQQVEPKPSGVRRQRGGVGAAAAAAGAAWAQSGYQPPQPQQPPPAQGWQAPPTAAPASNGGWTPPNGQAAPAPAAQGWQAPPAPGSAPPPLSLAPSWVRR